MEKPTEKDWEKVITKFLLDLGRSKFVKIVIFKIFGKSIGGFYGWILTFVLENFYNYVGVPVALWMRRKGAFWVDRTTGKVRIKRILSAESSGNEEDYDNNIGDI